MQWSGGRLGYRLRVYFEKYRRKQTKCRENIMRACNIMVRNLLNLLGNKECWEVVPKGEKELPLTWRSRSVGRAIFWEAGQGLTKALNQDGGLQRN